MLFAYQTRKDYFHATCCMKIYILHATKSVEQINDTTDNQLETSISGLGENVDVPVNVPRYDTCHTSIVATGEKGKPYQKSAWAPFTFLTC